MSKGYRVLLLILALLLLFGVAYESAERAHDCSGEDCPICEVLTVLFSLTFVLPVLLVLGIMRAKRERNRISQFCNEALSDTPVMLKTKLIF